MSIVLKDFLWAPNGFDTIKVAAGEDHDFGSLTAGLAEAGLIGDEPVEPLKADAPAAPASEPNTPDPAPVAEPVISAADPVVPDATPQTTKAAKSAS